MTQLIEGEWKNFRIRMIGIEDFPAVSQHLRANFSIDEPLYQRVGSSETQLQDVDAIVAGILGMDDKLSFAAFDKDSGKIAALSVSYLDKKSSHLSASFRCQSVERAILVNFMKDLFKACNVFEKYDIEECGSIYAASVDREFRRQGLAFEMCRRTVVLLKALGIPAVESLFTSPYTRKIATQLGFEELGRRNVRELQDFDGKYLCPDAGDEFVAVLALKL